MGFEQILHAYSNNRTAPDVHRGCGASGEVRSLSTLLGVRRLIKTIVPRCLLGPGEVQIREAAAGTYSV